jgi:ABC-type transporter Mla MlaB component
MGMAKSFGVGIYATDNLMVNLGNLDNAQTARRKVSRLCNAPCRLQDVQENQKVDSFCVSRLVHLARLARRKMKSRENQSTHERPRACAHVRGRYVTWEKGVTRNANRPWTHYIPLVCFEVWVLLWHIPLLWLNLPLSNRLTSQFQQTRVALHKIRWGARSRSIRPLSYSGNLVGLTQVPLIGRGLA